MSAIAADTPRLVAVWRSFMSLPAWVKAWVVLFLVPANLASLAFLDTWTGVAAAVAFAFVGLANMTIMLLERGLGRLMAVPHLIAWGPLQVALVLRVTGEVGGLPPQDNELAFILVLLVVNGISLGFDLLDTIRWLAGERAVAGHV